MASSNPPLDPALQQYAQSASTSYAAHNQQNEAPLSQSQPYYQAAGALDPALDDTGAGHDSNSDYHASPGHDDHQGDGGKPGDAKRPRACDSCRALKVRCDIEPTSGLPCKRCAKAKRPCVVTPPTRKRQKKADSRVAELEKKIDALTASLQAQRAGPPSDSPYSHHHEVPHSSTTPSSYHNTPQSLHIDPQMQSERPWAPHEAIARRSLDSMGSPDLKRRRLDGPDNTSYIGDRSSTTHREDRPSVEKNSEKWANFYEKNKPSYDHSSILRQIDTILDVATAERIVERYIHKCTKDFPAVVFPPGTTAKDVRESKPIVYCAILAAVSYGIASDEAQKALIKTYIHAISDCVLINVEKSLEVIQAIHIGVLWYRPPGHFEQHNFSQMVNMSMVIALDLGLGRPKSVAPRRLVFGDPQMWKRLPDADSIESRRTWLVCYYMGTSINMVLRRPLLIRWSRFIEETIDILSTSPEALPSDKALCKHAKVAHINEQIGSQFSWDDPTNNVSLSSPNVNFQIKHFENQLSAWKEKNKGNLSPLATFDGHVTGLYIYEIALHGGSCAGDSAAFRPPFNEEPAKLDIFSPNHLIECLSHCKGALDTFIAIPFSDVYVLPVVFSVRVVYALVILLRLYHAAVSPSESERERGASNIFTEEDLAVEYYLDALHQRFQQIQDVDRMGPHSKFLLVIGRLKDRYGSMKEGASNGPGSGNSGNDDMKMSRKPSQDQGNKGIPTYPSNTQSTGNTSLHLLSEVAMGNSNNTATSQQQQGMAQPGWYDPTLGTAAPMGDMSAMNYNMDLAGFDFLLGEGDWSGLLNGDGQWNFDNPNTGITPYFGTING